MDLLLDTHAFIWFFNGDEQLSIKAKRLIQDPKVTKFISIASIWEVAIKIAIKKLVFDGLTSEVVELIDKNGFKILQISVEHIVALEELELTHRDPFDRILVAQAMVEKMAIVTRDENIQKYQIKTLW
jgi:PIN domain nuclease of toxin-antitoxin system